MLKKWLDAVPAKTLLLQLSGLVGSGLHGIYGCGAEAHFFQYLAAGDGGAAGGGYHVFKLCGVHAGFKYHLGGAHYGLGSKAVSGCAGKTFQDAAIALIGQAVGANRKDMARRFAWLCTGIGIGIMALSGMGLWVFAPALMGIFTADAAVIALGARVLRIEAFAEPMFGASIVASGSMQGAGDSTGCFILNLVSMWGVRLTLAVLLAPRFGLVGVWVAMCAELCTRGALFLLRMARGKWLDKGALA